MAIAEGEALHALLTDTVKEALLALQQEDNLAS